jgi:hypothetical protein
MESFRSHKEKLALALATVLAIAALGLPSAIRIANAPSPYIGAKAEITRMNLFNCEEVITDQSIEQLIEQNRAVMAELARSYNVPAQALEALMLREIGTTSVDEEDRLTCGLFGMGKVSEQQLKADINFRRLTVLNDKGDYTPDGKYQLGLSYGLLNQKPGQFTLAVIMNIKNQELRKTLLESYNHTEHHANDLAIAQLVTDIPTALELAAAHMEFWVPAVSQYAKDHTEVHYYGLLSCFNSSFPNAQCELYERPEIRLNAPVLYDPGSHVYYPEEVLMALNN